MPRAWKVVLPVVVVLGGLAFAGWWFFLRDDAPPEAALPARHRAVDGLRRRTCGGRRHLDGAAGRRGVRRLPHQGAVRRRHDREDGCRAIAGRDRDDDCAGHADPGGHVRGGPDRADQRLRPPRLQPAGRRSADRPVPDGPFALTAPITLPAPPSLDTPVEVQATGDLTLHGVTKPVTVALKARWNGDLIDVAGTPRSC